MCIRDRVGSSTRAISSTDISSQRLTNHSLYPLYVSIGAVKTSLLISYFLGMFAHNNLKNFSPHSVGLKIFFVFIFSIGFPINLLKFEWKNNSELDVLLKNYLKNESTLRGIFLEIPELDLIDVNQLINFEKLIDIEDIIKEKYIFDELIKVKISKTGIDQWSIVGDINMTVNERDFINPFIEQFKKHTKTSINKMLEENVINTSINGIINISVANINSYQDYERSRKVIENFVGLRDIDISRFDIDTVFYKLGIYGDFDSIVKEISESNFFEIVSQYKDNSEININFVR